MWGPVTPPHRLRDLSRLVYTKGYLPDERLLFLFVSGLGRRVLLTFSDRRRASLLRLEMLRVETNTLRVGERERQGQWQWLFFMLGDVGVGV